MTFASYCFKNDQVKLSWKSIRQNCVLAAVLGWNAVASASLSLTKSGLVADFVRHYGVNSQEMLSFRYGLRTRQFHTSAEFWQGLRAKCPNRDATCCLAMDAFLFPPVRFAREIPTIPDTELTVQGEIILGRSQLVAPLGLARDIRKTLLEADFNAARADDQLGVISRLAAMQDKQRFFLWQIAEFNRFMVAGVNTSVAGRYGGTSPRTSSNKFLKAIAGQLAADDDFRNILLWQKSATFLAFDGPYQDPESKSARWWILGKYWRNHRFTPTPQELRRFLLDLEPLATANEQMAALMSDNVLSGILDGIVGSVSGCRIPPESQSNELIDLFVKQWEPLLEPKRIHQRPWAGKLIDDLLDHLDHESPPDLYLREWIDRQLRFIETHPETNQAVAAELNNAIYQSPERFRPR